MHPGSIKRFRNFGRAVRVERGGAQYRVFVLDNRDERDLVVTVLGPFSAGSGSASR